MKSLVWEAPRSMVLRETPMPVVQPDEVLIRVAYGGICGSELSGYLGHNSLRVPPLVMGHEFSGEIVEMGEQATEINPALSMGGHVTVNPLFCTDNSIWDRRGLNQLCPQPAADRRAPARRLRRIHCCPRPDRHPPARGDVTAHGQPDRTDGLWHSHR